MKFIIGSKNNSNWIPFCHHSSFLLFSFSLWWILLFFMMNWQWHISTVMPSLENLKALTHLFNYQNICCHFIRNSLQWGKGLHSQTAVDMDQCEYKVINLSTFHKKFLILEQVLANFVILFSHLIFLIKLFLSLILVPYYDNHTMIKKMTMNVNAMPYFGV